ncbi:MAG: hypothetical protein NTY02_05050, partial [Acidobacteria bacterium]|nr:hypothetical protein [Acidobacteriota bacterium]
VDGEYMMVTAIPASGFVDVRARGDRGGTAKAHNILAPVTFGLASDMVGLPAREAIPIPAKDFDLAQLGADVAALPCPIRDTIYFINKASALGTTTLGNPGADQNGLRVTFINTTDYAAVVTVAACYDGSTGAHTTLTSPAYQGAGLTLIAWQTKWFVLAQSASYPWIIS